uniref:Pentacotripeptide-repeat region of PRORP domain-containing protein n=1 Tax=Odontella aurita TaxID=265563 RepID=A0A7S4IIK3_9STRA|mmetsp:Transcript_25531/g.75237  ORF Transcript_25531/g.75237 Transcript_25531/m.75237 type:complete len:784 (+) Transcript_25531:64-2415(+)
MVSSTTATAAALTRSASAALRGSSSAAAQSRRTAKTAAFLRRTATTTTAGGRGRGRRAPIAIAPLAPLPSPPSVYAAARYFSAVATPSPAEVNYGDEYSGDDDGLPLPPLRHDQFDPDGCIRDVRRAAKWNQRGLAPVAVDDDDDDDADAEDEDYDDDGEEDEDGLEVVTGGKRWDPSFARRAVDDYERHLRYIHLQLKEGQRQQQKQQNIQSSDSSDSSSYDSSDPLSYVRPDDPKIRSSTSLLLSASIAERALKALLRSNLHTSDLSARVRRIERLVGMIGHTPLTDKLSLRLLEANGKAGNVGRALSLLQLRKGRMYRPKRREFRFAVQSVRSAGLYLRTNRNVFASGGERSGGGAGGGADASPAGSLDKSLDNPTRFLDAILLNMSSRGAELDLIIANKMLDCYASTGRTGRASHFFYRVVRTPVDEEEGEDDDGDDDGDEYEYEGGGDGNEYGDEDVIGKRRGRYAVRMKMRPLPPFRKIPSEVGDRPVEYRGGSSAADRESKNAPSPSTASPSSSETGTIADADTATAVTTTAAAGKPSIEWESSPEWSPPLTAAFAFFESLGHGACGHQSLRPDVVSYNTLLKACCRRGALHRALKLLDGGMEGRGVLPDAVSYNTVLSGLARVGDVRRMRELLVDVTNNTEGVEVDKYTVMAMVDGYLNVGDVPSAVTLVQDLFNQHDALPPYTSHLKIFEHALALELPHEARRHLHFLRQLRRWESPPLPTTTTTTEGKGEEEKRMKELQRNVDMTRNHPKLGREALGHLFEYFGDELREEDFY